MSNDSEVFDRLSARYEAGNVPWDDPLPPPEVTDFMPSLTPGRALDLGCGFGRASIFMARLGWEVDGIDFVPQAVAEAARRALLAGVEVRFHICDVTDLDFLAGPYDFALDVGCGHNLSARRWRVYREQLHRLLRPDGHFMLFVRLQDVARPESGDGPTGVDEASLLATFADGFGLDWRQHGKTDVPGQPIWPSAWYRFRRL